VKLLFSILFLRKYEKAGKEEYDQKKLFHKSKVQNKNSVLKIFLVIKNYKDDKAVAIINAEVPIESLGFSSSLRVSE
jgi:hypothetical protein